ncbi:putative repeat protein (TIGR03806 family) [Chryseobacterium defluvii]|uniref:Putative repeat protein (TIGR03806 family) n=1 Tax=Chryseobacterium defluvii TaxID=160396 RepID=A0A840KEQ7_9FLAO|nr:hypothetical protein [Chryseobacterium defluvii]MBB4808049.1 putative repeat protein (TIGR03806 family) [Chryseobacterium defluvii]
MKKIYFLSILCLFWLFSCKNDEAVVEVAQGSFVNFNINEVPYAKLSTYAFFTGDLKNLTPSSKVLPFEPASSLFTDYALKKRFIWMPAGTKATYVAGNKILEFPVGTVLIKNFYYNTIQPGNTTKIIETRLMIKKSSGWIFAEYLWNDAQTEADLVTGTDFMSGSSQNITFKKENGDIVNIDYRIPSQSECLTCHKLGDDPAPIGLKPQNLNNNYNYPGNIKNQLQKLVDEGYLVSYPANIASTVNYKDTSQPLDIRLRSYLDINCAHCHEQEGHCNYRALRLNFSSTTNLANLGVCVTADEPIDPTIQKIIRPGNHLKSVMNFRLDTEDESVRMPLLGRTIVDDKGVLLLQQWIDSFNQPCN